MSAIGRDRAGIVAAITEGLLEIDANVEDSRITILGGHFAVMLLVATGDGREREDVEAALSVPGERLGLEALSVSEVGDASEVHPSPDHVITVYGSDHPGIVHRSAPSWPLPGSTSPICRPGSLGRRTSRST